MSERPNEPSGAAPRPDDDAIGPPAAEADAANVPPSSVGSPDGTGGPRFGIGRADAPPPPARGGGTLGWIALTVALLVAAVAASPWWAPPLAPLLPWSAQPGAASSEQGQRGIEERLAALEQRGATAAGTAPPEMASLQRALDKVNQQLAGLEQRLAATEQAVAQLGQGSGQNAVSGGSEDLAPLRAETQRQGAEIAKFGDRVAAIEKQLAARPPADPAALADVQANLGKLGAALAELEARVATLAGATETSGARIDQALLLSLGQLRQAMQGSGPFAAELAAAVALAQERPDVAAALAPLAEPAARGLPSMVVLRQRFEGLAGAIAAAGTAPAAADDWSEQILGKLRGLVTVRRVGPGGAPGGAPGGVANGTAEAAVATAETALAGDDLAGAVAALETLHGPAMLAARDWLDAARRRLAAQAALDKATGLVTARLAADQRQAAPMPAQPTPAQGAKP